jgi:hypothetical protein
MICDWSYCEILPSCNIYIPIDLMHHTITSVIGDSLPESHNLDDFRNSANNRSDTSG